MPFDGIPGVTGLSPFRQRREGAARIWRSKRPEEICFDCWYENGKGCAIGWLGAEEYDGWSLKGRAGRPTLYNDGSSVMTQAAKYFGITEEQAITTFLAGCDPMLARATYDKDASKVTGDDVADRLLALPITEEIAPSFTVSPAPMLPSVEPSMTIGIDTASYLSTVLALYGNPYGNFTLVDMEASPGSRETRTRLGLVSHGARHSRLPFLVLPGRACGGVT